MGGGTVGEGGGTVGEGGGSEGGGGDSTTFPHVYPSNQLLLIHSAQSTVGWHLHPSLVWIPSLVHGAKLNSTVDCADPSGGGL